MTSRLSSDTIAQMAPLLGSLSRLVAKGSQLSEVQLRTLLRGIDLEAEPALMQEAKFWMELLQNLSEDPSEEMRQVTVEALLLRGLPEASALLAVSEVIKGRGKSKIKVSPERLDLGELAAGQTATIEFKIEGGTGHIMMESDQVQVTPNQFGPQQTRIRVEVRPMVEGVLWTSLKLMTTAGETVEVPVQAQWVSGGVISTPDTTHKANEHWLDMGRSYYRANRFADALSAFEEAIRLDPGDATAYNDQGKALRRLNRYREALAAFERANELDSRYATAFYEKGDTLLRLNRYEEALIAFDQAIYFAPLYAYAYKGKGETLNNFNRGKEALMAIEQSIQFDPRLADAYLLKGELLNRLNRKDAALAAYRQAVDAYERSIQLDPDDAHMYFGKGFTLYRLERYEEALAINECALQQDPHYTLALHSKSRTLWKLNRNEEALAICEHLLQLDPDYVDAHNIKGLVLRNLKRYNEALVSHEQALRLNPKEAILHLNKGVELHNLKRYEEAVVIYEQAIRLDPINVHNYDWKGATLYTLKRYEEALASYEQAIRLDLNNASLHNWRGVMLYSLDRYEEALPAFEKAIQLNPGEAVYHHNKGNTLSKLSRNQEALVAFERAMKLDASYTKDYNDMLELIKKSTTATPSSGLQTGIPEADKFNRFTERARKVLSLAQEEAQRFQHNYIGTEHLLLGLVREGDGVAARVLSNLGVELRKVRSAVEFIIGRGDRIVLGEIGLTPRAKKVIELAVDEARRLNHHYIGTEHLLLGLVREGEGIAAGVLESLGVNLEKVRTETIRVLSQSR